MISKNKATRILNSLFGHNSIDTSNSTSIPKFNVLDSTYKYLQPSATVYLGLTSVEPNHTSGSVSGEPTMDTTTVTTYGYNRKLVGGYSLDSDDSARPYFLSGATEGIIKNNKEIQFNTALKDYPEKMIYWFLSEGNASSSVAFLWGKIKDILHETGNTAATFNEIDAKKNNRKYIEYTIANEKLFTLSDGEKVIVSWDGKDYEVTAKVVTRLGYNEALGETEADSVLTRYIYIGNPDFDPIEEDEANGTGNLPASDIFLPFAISYKIQKAEEIDDGTSVSVTQRSEGRLRFYTFEEDDYGLNEDQTEIVPTHEFGLYGIGINIPASTVPTFYQGQLQASLDVSLTGN